MDHLVIISLCLWCAVVCYVISRIYEVWSHEDTLFFRHRVLKFCVVGLVAGIVYSVCRNFLDHHISLGISVFISFIIGFLFDSYN
jgi:chromate transport protein ChrA